MKKPEVRLRALADRLDETFDPSFGQPFRDAADAIAREKAEVSRLRAELQEARADAQHYMANGAEAIRELAIYRAGVDKARKALAPFAAVCPPDDMLDEEGDEPTPLSETPSSCALFVHELAAAKHALSELDAMSGKEGV